ncbi:DUF5667 domain-containing protein [Paenibacillus soyae]|uniref:DUF5667 domain-containing protein n=1 Tax=Paenibacillus soyae TaxID=2969249 RepID=A0A9X2N085_9BACL|nr:DUF5667 domain-containing protein [Paenibacillus soyae]MCR2806667.1 DUF5667 domain-containing protein [Paenibacillus soyae]
MRTNKGYKGFIAKSTIISMLALSVGTGSAWADEAETQPSVATDAAATTSTTEQTTTTDLTSTTEVEQETPSLLPGDFFYFIKTMYERIQLAAASGDLDEAILLAQFAKERLAESAALYKEGKAELAEETLQRALAQQQQAVDAAASAETTDSNVEEEAAESTTPASTPAAESTDATATSVSEDQPAEDVNEEEEEADTEQADKVKSSLQHNIVALTAALEKVKNPQAQSSLLKNITKSFAKLEKKLTKLSEKNQDGEAAMSESTTVAVPATTTADGQETNASADASVESTEASAGDNDNDAASVKPSQEKKQKPNKEKDQKQPSGKPEAKQQNKSEKSQGNADRGKSAEHKKEAK